MRNISHLLRVRGGFVTTGSFAITPTRPLVSVFLLIGTLLAEAGIAPDRSGATPALLLAVGVASDHFRAAEIRTCPCFLHDLDI